MDFIAFITDMRSAVTVVSMMTFIGIVIWAYSASRKADFDEAAQLPFADEDDVKKIEGAPRHG